MRNFWKRANRGLILGGVLVLGTAAYVGIDYFRFSHGKETMEQVLKNYTADLSKAAITPESQAIYEYQKTDAEKEAAYKALGDVIRTYWTDTHDSNADYHYQKSDLLMNMHDIAYSTELPGYVTGYTANISKVKFTKNGPGAASFSMNLDMVIDTYGPCYFPTLGSYEGSYYYNKTNGADDEKYTDLYTDEAISLGTDSAKDDEKENDDDLTYYEGALRTTASLTYYGELLYEDGTWKISWLDCDWDGGIYPIQTTPQEGGN